MTANTGEAFEHIISTYVNPVTRKAVSLVPPAECMNQEEYDELMSKFADFCAEAWKDKRDPETIDPRKFRAWGEDED
jgi:hypothetical protein